MIRKDAACEELAVYRIEKLTYLPQVVDFGVYKDKQLLEVYNRKQLYPALGYLAPVEFELLHGRPLAGLTGGAEALLGWRVLMIVIGLLGLSFYLQGRKRLIHESFPSQSVMEVLSSPSKNPR